MHANTALRHIYALEQKRLAQIGAMQIGCCDLHAHKAQSVASADVCHHHRMKTHFALPGRLPGSGRMDTRMSPNEHKEYAAATPNFIEVILVQLLSPPPPLRAHKAYIEVEFHDFTVELTWFVAHRA